MSLPKEYIDSEKALSAMDVLYVEKQKNPKALK